MQHDDPRLPLIRLATARQQLEAARQAASAAGERDLVYLITMSLCELNAVCARRLAAEDEDEHRVRLN